MPPALARDRSGTWHTAALCAPAAPRGTHRPPPRRAEHERARPSRSLRAEGPSSFLAGLRATVYRNAVWNGQAAPRGALPASPARSGRVHLVRGEGRDLSGHYGERGGGGRTRTPSQGKGVQTWEQRGRGDALVAG